MSMQESINSGTLSQSARDVWLKESTVVPNKTKIINAF